VTLELVRTKSVFDRVFEVVNVGLEPRDRAHSLPLIHKIVHFSGFFEIPILTILRAEKQILLWGREGGKQKGGKRELAHAHWQKLSLQAAH